MNNKGNDDWMEWNEKGEKKSFQSAFMLFSFYCALNLYNILDCSSIWYQLDTMNDEEAVVNRRRKQKTKGKCGRMEKMEMRSDTQRDIN